MPDMFDSVMDAVGKFADGCSKMEERMDALEKRRADGVGEVDHIAAAGKHMTMGNYHLGQSQKKRGGNPDAHTHAMRLHANAAVHHFFAHDTQKAGHKEEYKIAAAHASKSSQLAHKASEAL